MSEPTLEYLLFIEHDGDETDDPVTNIHVFSYMLMCNLICGGEEYKRFNTPAIIELCEEIKQNVPRDIYKDRVNNAPPELDRQHPKINTYMCYRHCLEYALTQIGW